MDVSLSSGEVATILRALKAYVPNATDDAYKNYAVDLISIITTRWEELRPGDTDVVGDAPS